MATLASWHLTRLRLASLMQFGTAHMALHSFESASQKSLPRTRTRFGNRLLAAQSGATGAWISTSERGATGSSNQDTPLAMMGSNLSLRATAILLQHLRTVRVMLRTKGVANIL